MENTLCLHYEHHSVNTETEITAIYSESNRKHVNTQRVGKEQGTLMLNQVVDIVTSMPG
jgi:hypothetical protein